ncbi:MAG TPA: hypothetical protein VJT73_18265 [Polyangiaceae bacterium]|nr:hypothetical protein [Polyangiaceae bacterium]
MKGHLQHLLVGWQLAGWHFTVIGDTQRTTPWGRLIGNENNDPERRLLLPEIAARRPALVVPVCDLPPCRPDVR